MMSSSGYNNSPVDGTIAGDLPVDNAARMFSAGRQPGRPTSGCQCQAGCGACGGDYFECSGRGRRGSGMPSRETIALLVERRPRYPDRYGCRPIKERALIKIANPLMIASALVVVAACSQSPPPAPPLPPAPPEPLPMAAPALPPEAPYVAPGATSHGTTSERSGGTRVGRRGMNGGMHDMNGGMNEGPSVTTRHPSRRARRPRLAERAARKAGGLLADSAGEIRSKFAGSCAMTAMPDRRRGSRGGHHTGSPVELSGLTPLDLVFCGVPSGAAGLSLRNATDSRPVLFGLGATGAGALGQSRGGARLCRLGAARTPAGRRGRDARDPLEGYVRVRYVFDRKRLWARLCGACNDRQLLSDDRPAV